MEIELFKLALSVISGRNTFETLNDEDWSNLGYDTYKFSYFGKPSENELKAQCEGIVVDIVSKVLEP